MNTTMPTQATAPAHTQPIPSRRVIDAPTRAFHWLFALCFLGAYLSADGERWRLLHVTLGYTLAGLLVFRVAYGMIGPRHVRLNLLRSKLSSGGAWLHGLGRARAVTDVNWRQGQNLLLALAVVVILLAVVPVTLTGYAAFNDWGWGGDWFEELHEWTGEALLWGVLVHLGAMLVFSLWRRKNLSMPMLTGRTEGRGPDLAQHNHGLLAWALVASVLTYWTWEWQQSPQGLIRWETPAALTPSIENEN